MRPTTLRYYERIGLLPVPRRENGRRRYDERIFPRLTIIAMAQHMGFTIAEIQTLLHGFAPERPAWQRWQELATRKLPEIDALIAQAQEMKRLLEASLACDCLTFDECAVVLESHASIPT